MSGVMTLGLEREGASGGDANFRLDVGSVLSRSLRAWAGNLVPFSLVGLAVYSPVLLLLVVLALTGTHAGLSRIVDLVTNFLTMALSGAVTYGAFQHLHGRPARTADVLQVGLSKFGGVWVTAFLVGLATVVGLLFLIVPGLIMMIRYWVAIPAQVIESPGATASLRRSEELTAGNRWAIFALALILGVGVFVVTLLAVGALGVVLGMLGHSLAAGAEAGTNLGPWAQGAIIVLMIPVHCLTSVAPAVAYHDLRVGKEGVDVDELLRVFE